MMKICPVCDRPARDLIRTDDILMCDRCADAVDVGPAMRHMDSGEWRDPTLAGPPVAPRRPRWPVLAGAVAVLALGIAAWGLSGGKEPPPPAAEPVAAPAPRPAPPPSPDPERKRGRATLREAEEFLRSFDGGVARAAELETALRIAEKEFPEALSLRARLYAALGRTGEAHSALDRVLSATPGDRDALLSKGRLVLTSWLLLGSGDARGPELMRVLKERIAAEYGKPASATELASAFAHAARGEFAEARAAILRLDDRKDLDPVVAALQYLERPGLRTAMDLRRRVRVDLRAGEAGREERIWIQALPPSTGRRGRRPAPPPYSGAPIHAGLLRIRAAGEEDAGKALELLETALHADPRDIRVRLDRVAALERLGREGEAAEARAAAAGLAATLGFPESAIREILP